jgi:hypothetical protein
MVDEGSNAFETSALISHTLICIRKHPLRTHYLPLLSMKGKVNNEGEDMDKLCILVT